MASAFKELYDPAYWQEIDADRSVAELAQVLLTITDRTIEALPSEELSLLW